MSLGKEHSFSQYLYHALNILGERTFIHPIFVSHFKGPWRKENQQVRINQQITDGMNINPYTGILLNKYCEAKRGLVLSFGIKLTGFFADQNKTIDC